MPDERRSMRGQLRLRLAAEGAGENSGVGCAESVLAIGQQQDNAPPVAATVKDKVRIGTFVALWQKLMG